MTRLSVVSIALLLSACALFPIVPAIPTDYAGPDGGYVVAGIGAAKGIKYSSYYLLFRKKDASLSTGDSFPRASLSFDPYFFSKRLELDYKDDVEQGTISSARLAPGVYEVYRCGEWLDGYMFQAHYDSKTPFSIPFEVKPGEVVYLGNFQANSIRGKNAFAFGLPVPAGAVYVVEDRKDRDLALLRKRMPELPQVVVDSMPTSVDSPFFAFKSKDQ